MRSCFVFAAAASEGAPETLRIFDEIGFWGVQAKDFVTDLGKVSSKVLNVEINSPGGDVFAGLAIYNALRASGKEIVVKVMGVAASAASLIAMAGDKIIMPSNTFMMVHNPWVGAVGNAAELRDTADTLDKIGASLKAVYVAKTGLDEAAVDALLAKDTWLTAEEAKTKGFATEVIDEIKVKAAFDMARAELPAAVTAMFASGDGDGKGEGWDGVSDDLNPDDPDGEFSALADGIKAAADAADMGGYAGVFALTCTSMDEAKARIGVAREVRALCAVAGKPDAADAAIRAGKTLGEVRAALVAEQAAADDATHTDGTVKDALATGDSAKPKVSPASLWASHKGQTNRKDHRK